MKKVSAAFIAVQIFLTSLCFAHESQSSLGAIAAERKSVHNEQLLEKYQKEYEAKVEEKKSRTVADDVEDFVKICAIVMSPLANEMTGNYPTSNSAAPFIWEKTNPER